jgi:hypothetical protein
VIIDMAVHARAPIVPVRFAGGLPRAPAPARLDFPLGFGRQDHWIGAPILPEALEAMPYGERRAAVAHAAILMSLARERDLQPAWQRVIEGMRTGRLVVEDTAEDRAVAAIAADLYGPRGPQIVVR